MDQVIQLFGGCVAAAVPRGPILTIRIVRTPHGVPMPAGLAWLDQSMPILRLESLPPTAWT
jgi:hypothetical protein